MKVFLVGLLCFLTSLCVAWAEMPDYMRVIEDNEFIGWTFYQHIDFKLVAGSRNYVQTFQPYVGVNEDGLVALHIVSEYKGTDWIFFETVQYLVTDKAGEKRRGSYDVEYFKKKTDVTSRGTVEESIDTTISARKGDDQTDITENILTDILDAQVLQIRLHGKDGNKDATFKDDDLRVIQESIQAYLNYPENEDVNDQTDE